MNAAVSETEEPRCREPRLWPVAIVLTTQAVFFALSIAPSINNAVRFVFMLVGPALGLLLFLGWLLFASRLPWAERGIHAGIMAGLALVVAPLVHPTMWLGLFIYGAPLWTIVLPSLLLLLRHQPRRSRTAMVATGLAVAWAIFPLLRIDGFNGQYLPELRWRWSPTAEQRLLAEAMAPDSVPNDSWEPQAALWPGFRGPARNSRAEYGSDPLDWMHSPPKEIWRIRIGPGWSSFAHVSGRLFTQEQRGEQEAVSCYDARTGDLIWLHTTPVRFSDVVSGAGPRATPTFSGSRLFAFGAKATLSSLDPTTGKLLWQRHLMREVNADLPIWGFAGSPLVVDETVIVYADGAGEHGLVAYHAGTGEPAWQIASHGMNFSSAQAVTLADEPAVLFGDSGGLFALAPSTGKKLWSHKPDGWRGPAVCQPQQIGGHDLIVPLGDGIGLARLEVTRDANGWRVRERWSSRGLRPSFNDFIYHEGHLYGLDKNIFACLDAETGKRNWKNGRYGFGQVILLADTEQMIVTTEDGHLVLLGCDPDGLEEQGRIIALEGKTWNHPVVVQDRLFVRNSREAVCYEL